ncbi:MAG: DUF559 domain-containing protein [Elusimicrobiota bacterium]|jgi:very-short-patch-repair endonuclease
MPLPFALKRGLRFFSRRMHSQEDADRTSFLERSGYRVLRFWNSEVLDDIDAVLTTIGQALHSLPPSSPIDTQKP